jgi:hypothetical protein
MLLSTLKLIGLIWVGVLVLFVTGIVAILAPRVMDLAVRAMQSRLARRR